MKLNLENLINTNYWDELGIKIPQYDLLDIVKKSYNEPKWVHFGPGNIFRGFVAPLVQRLLNKGLESSGIIGVEPRSDENIRKIYSPHDNLSLLAVIKSDGNIEIEIIGSIVGYFVADPFSKDWQQIKNMFANPSLQIVSFTITEKAYKLIDFYGDFIDEVKKDIEEGIEKPKHIISKIASLLYHRYKTCNAPIALMSLDNFSKNSVRLFESIKLIAEEWIKRNYIESEFLDYLNDPKMVSYPITMIDNIVPAPMGFVCDYLKEKGFEDIDIVKTTKGNFVAPFVNAEETRYLVVEDNFANGRPPLDKVNVILTDKDTVIKADRMKVTTCLNPIHTASAIIGKLLGFQTVYDVISNEYVENFLKNMVYKESLNVMEDPKVINPEKFLDEVFNKRLKNKYIKDSIGRILTDTSQKMPVRFGETIKAYVNSEKYDADSLVYIPMVIAFWLRYLMGIDDNGKPFEICSDPLLENLKYSISKIKMYDKKTVDGNLREILSNKNIFGLDLYKINLGKKIEDYFSELISEKGSVFRLIKSM